MLCGLWTAETQFFLLTGLLCGEDNSCFLIVMGQFLHRFNF